jgi:hypothetical protein
LSSSVTIGTINRVGADLRRGSDELTVIDGA